jgi:hypothetical protein
VRDFTSGLNWQEKNLTLTPTSLQGLLIALPKVAKVAQERSSSRKSTTRSRKKSRSARR